MKRIRDRDERFIDCIEGWRGAISFRNILAHGYDQVDNELVWEIVVDDLPELAESLRNTMAKDE